VKNATPEAYRVDDNSLLLGFYKRVLWDRLVARIPDRVHPNTLTIASQAFALLAVIASVAAVLRGPALHAVSALCLMTCLTLDNVDGAHARRTGQCSPLGELLDHGLDGITSASVLIVTCLVLHLDAGMTVVVCGLGALALASVFWEQFRTGLLTLPKISPTEGMTLLAVWQLVAAVFGDPWWLRFSFERVTVGTVAVVAFVVVHVAALFPPFVRAARVGVKGWELSPLFVLTGLQLGFALRGAVGIVPAVTVGLMAAGVTCRMILLRHDGERGPILAPALYLAAVPAVLALALPNLWTATGWATVSLAIVAADYAWTFWRSARRLAETREAFPAHVTAPA
jgi:phosphatidylglycerophosphate synthase